MKLSAKSFYTIRRNPQGYLETFADQFVKDHTTAAQRTIEQCEEPDEQEIEDMLANDSIGG